MKTSIHSRAKTHAMAERPWWAMPVAFMVTLLALPVNAGIVVPDDPLTSSVRVAPNIAFILDNSGSMALVSMPTKAENFDVEDPDYTGTSTGRDRIGLRDDPHDRSYLNNGVYYNPNVTYQPWMKADGNRMSGGQDPAAVFLDWNKADDGRGTRDLRDNAESIFYVPKTGVTSSTTASDFVRYWVRNNGGTAEVVREDSRAMLLQVTQNVPEAGWATCRTVSVPAGTGVLEVTIAGNTNNRGDADLYIKRTACPGNSSGTYDYRSVGNSSDEVITISNPQAGNWSINVYNGSSGSNDRSVHNNVLTVNAVTVVAATPTGRSQADELTNIATWYSYYRTRMKAAKGGASEAFRNLGAGQRVGLRFINSGTAPNNNLNIPVGKGDGRFVDASDGSYTNRSDWYSALHAATVADGATPLRKALYSAGQYFQNKTITGPYGPEATASQFSCRQNFSILTTDGYWNDSFSSVGDADGSSGTEITGPKGKSYTYSPAWPYSDDKANTLADVAMYFWKNDLRDDLTNNVPDSSADPAFWQHMVTFSISIGLSGARGWGSVGEVHAETSNKSWPDPINNSGSERIDDLLHAAVNGRGAFVAAADPSQFAAGLSKALATIAQRTSSFSNVSTNAATIKTGGKVFNASYVSGLWTGAVKAWTLDANNEPSTLAWEASIPAPASRKVFTIDGASGAVFPTSAQLTKLTRAGGPTIYPVTGAENAAYIKGDSSKEERNGGLLRSRAATVLGDIVNSSPAYVEDTNTLYVGANDGMLHAFNTDTGVEEFAYVPGLVNLDNLNLISRGDYTHKWFVDGPVVVTSRKLTPNKNYLVGAMGRGGKGLFGLDVTDPASFGTGNVTWELGGSDADMGLVTGRPILARVGGGTVAAIVGNGVNSTDNKAVLYVINAATGAIIKKLDTGAGSAAAPNGLSAPTGILGKDGRTLAYAYAGDRLGNVWKFDMSSASPASWTVTRMFTAKTADGTGAIQPITGGVTVATDPRTYKRWVFFGTGSYMTTTEADDKTPGTQGMYGIMDTGSPVTYGQLKKRSIINIGATQDGYPVRTFEAKSDLAATYNGWYMDLPGKGERIVQDAQLVSNILVTASMIPEGDACEASGSGYINALDAFTGTSAGKSFFDLDKDGDTTDQSIGGVPVGSVNFGVGMPTLPIFLDGKLIVGGTNAGEKPGSGGIVGKVWSPVSWREIRKD